MKDLKSMSADELSNLFYHGPTVPTKEIIAEYNRRAEVLERITIEIQGLYNSVSQSKMREVIENIQKILNEADNETSRSIKKI